MAFHFLLMMELISAVVADGYCIHRYGRMRVWNWDREFADKPSSGTSSREEGECFLATLVVVVGEGSWWARISGVQREREMERERGETPTIRSRFRLGSHGYVIEYRWRSVRPILPGTTPLTVIVSRFLLSIAVLLAFQDNKIKKLWKLTPHTHTHTHTLTWSGDRFVTIIKSPSSEYD